jgi:alanyl-tRNA synthetase
MGINFHLFLMMTFNNVRSAFLNYFKKNDHLIQSSSPLIPQNDPTLLFVNAGMVPFKDYFLGLKNPPCDMVTTSQKCVRAGGKHNDLENVGYTTRHHTFFEMLGNFSFGKYFKKEAIHMAWEFITRELNIPAEKLIITVHSSDDEAKAIWKALTHFGDDRILSINSDDNFWSMGDTGPCGPCTEIFYDHGAHILGGLPGTPQEDEGERYVEIWNIVFMQYNRDEKGVLHPLPKPCVDTGMGLERITTVLQNVPSNYHIDHFQTLIHAIKPHSHTAYDAQPHSYHVIADHLRAMCFLMSDGVLPSNEGRGYVLRRIMRRAMRHGYQLGIKKPFIYALVQTLIHEMKEAYPELLRAQSMIEENIRDEEERFLKTLEKGMHLIEDMCNENPSMSTLSGDVAFKLYDTYGFPIDLTIDILRPKGIDVDMEAYEKALSVQKERSSFAGSGEHKQDPLWYDLSKTIAPTEFRGYETLGCESNIKALVKNGVVVERLARGEEGILITSHTPFYAESGGQRGDIGTFKTSHPDCYGRIHDTQKTSEGLFLHSVYVEEGVLETQDVLLSVDEKHRRCLMAHHSATHLLHKALRDILGDHVHQKGSVVDAQYLRFDFSYKNPLPLEVIHAIEERVNAMICLNYPVSVLCMEPKKAIEEGALALFGEKYSQEVRVIRMGEKGHASHELCGGTHVERTGDIGSFFITSQAAVGSGIRRIEAVVGAASVAYAQTLRHHIQKAAHLLKTDNASLPERLSALIHERKDLKNQVKTLYEKALLGGESQKGKREDAEEFPLFKDVTYIEKHFKDIAPNDLKSLVDGYKKKYSSSVIVLSTKNEEKISLIIGVSPSLNHINASDVVKQCIPLIGGKGGGGRPDLAQGGGHDESGLEKVTGFMHKYLKNLEK